MTDPLLTSQGQFAQVFLAIHKPSVVLAAQVNQSFASLDDVCSVTFNNVTTGAYTNVLPEMRVLIGTAPGLWDLGMGRIRSATSTALLIGRQSEIQFADDMYITVIDDFYPWARQWKVEADGTVYMDYDVAYSDQNQYTQPVPIMGPDAVVDLVGATITHQRNASSSWSPDASSLTYVWQVAGPGTPTIDSSTSATPTFTFNAVGEFRITLTVTTAHGKSTTAHRRTFVFGSGYQPIENFTLETVTCSQADGGTSFRVVLHDTDVFAGTYGMPKLILYSKDVYGATAQSFGPLVGYENVISWGWVDQSTVDWAPNHSSVTIEVKGPASIMSQIDILAAGGLKTGGGSWLYTSAPRVDIVMWNLVHWRSNLDTIIDVLPTNDTRVASGIVTNNGTLWEQLLDVAGRVFAVACCDRYGRLVFSPDPQMVRYVDRSAIATTMILAKSDWREKITIIQRDRNVASQIYLGATDHADPFFSKAPGTMVARTGRSQTKNNILVSDQPQTNQLSGDYLAWQNNPYPTIRIPLRGNNRLIDVAPNQYVTLSIAAGDTPLGIVWTSKRLIPRRVTLKYSHKTGSFLVDLECEGESIGYDGVTYTPPTIPTTPTPVVPTPDPGVYVLPTPPPVNIPILKEFGWSLILGDDTEDLVAGWIGQIEVPFNCTITSAKLVTKPGVTGSIQLNILKCTYAQIETGVHPASSDSIVASSPPVLTAEYKSNNALTGWSTYLVAGDWLFFYVTSVSGLKLLTLALRGVMYQ